MTARLPASLEAAAIRRKAESQGGFATVIRSGDPDSGVILLVIIERGQYLSCARREWADGEYRWTRAGPTEPSELDDFLARQRRFDPDLWLIELDVPQGERFIVDLSAID
ncbi:DUF1491 family protein [Sphingomonas sp. ASV193]|uniref:DUF1491 family protein n=1 Tax=Sphingomonas sp. ASV193 TaxID=3144405 RepID=UPI0032E8F439